MGVYVSLSPATRQNFTPADIIQKLQTAGFSIAGQIPGECDLNREIDSEEPHSILLEMRDDRSNLVEVEINHNFPSHFCVWWRYSWGIGTAVYAGELSHILDLADVLGWEVHGNTAKIVTRETLSAEAERLISNAAAVKAMLGTVPFPPANVATSELSEKEIESLDAFILKVLEAMAQEHAESPNPDEI